MSVAKERLASALEAIGADAFAKLARLGRFDDVESRSTTPKHDLVEMLYAQEGAPDTDAADVALCVAFAKRVIRGDFDTVPQASAAYSREVVRIHD